jgi:hypothetical protein
MPTIDDLVESRFPFPIAARWRARTQGKCDARSTFALVETLVRLLLAIAAMEWTRGSRTAAIDWASLESPTLGGLLVVLEKLLDALEAERKDGLELVVPELLDWTREDAQGVSPKKLADRCRNLRNKWSHPDFVRADREQEFRDLGEANTAIVALASSVAWLARYRLMVVDEDRRDFDGTTIAKVKLLAGHHASPSGAKRSAGGEAL